MNHQPQKKSAANFDLSSLDLLELEDPFHPDKHPQQPAGEKYLVFFLNQRMYGIPSGQVAEIFQPLVVTRLFNVPEWLLGIAGFRNEVISVIDLKKLWNKQAPASSLKSKLIVLRADNAASPIAFAVDRLSKIVTLPKKDIRPVRDEKAPHISGSAVYEEKNLYLLDTEKFLSSLAV